MSSNFLIFAVIIFLAYILGKRKASSKGFSPTSTKSLSITNSFSSIPQYYGYCTALWSFVPAVILALSLHHYQPVAVYESLPDISQKNLLISGLSGFLFLVISVLLIRPVFNARKHIEGWVKALFIFCAFVSVSITIFIFISVLSESLRFFSKVNFFDFLFGLQWSPQTALRADQAGSSGQFGIIPVFAGTFLITIIAMFVAVPLGLMSAIFLTEYSSQRFRNSVKPILEILAGIPTVVYGYFAAITLGPLLNNQLQQFGFDVASESALAAGFVMGIMIIPYMMSLADDVMNAVPKALRDASLGLGATKSETIRKVVIPAALPGIMGAFLLAVSRAIGETMIVTMAAGLIAKLTANPFESVTTVTAQIVKLLVGDQEFDSAKTLAAFALSLTLFVVTLLLNVAALIIVRKYREKYE